jgi:GTP cyclohydrolase I
MAHTDEKILMDEIGDSHMSTSTETPMKPDAFVLSNAEKKAKIEEHFHEIMDTLGLDMTDDSLKGTPHRVAKMFVNEIFSGLDPAAKPKMSTFDNKYNYNKMLVEKHISVNSTCEHHFLPIVGKAHVAYISTGKVIGLSKMNRIVDYYSRRPQVQERLTMQIMNELKEALDTENVAVVIEAQHLCVTSRGITDRTSTTVTVEYSGEFNNDETKAEFLKYIGDGFNIK